MHCPFCNATETKVTDSRLSGEGDQVRRRRECLDCQARFTTYEVAELSLPRLVKQAGYSESFDEQKLRQGLLKAVQKRPVRMEQIEEIILRIKHKLWGYGEREVPTQVLGTWVMEELQKIDAVAYVRFASVYRQFQDLEAFQTEIERLRSLAKTVSVEALEANEL